MFAGVVVFSVIGFKATATFDKCVVDRAAMVLANSTAILPVCDLQKELDNVSLKQKAFKDVRGFYLCKWLLPL